MCGSSTYQTRRELSDGCGFDASKHLRMAPPSVQTSSSTVHPSSSSQSCLLCSCSPSSSASSTRSSTISAGFSGRCGRFDRRTRDRVSEGKYRDSLCCGKHQTPPEEGGESPAISTVDRHEASHPARLAHPRRVSGVDRPRNSA